MEARIATVRVRYARHATSILVQNFHSDSATPSTGGFEVLAEKRLRLAAHSSGGLSAWHLRSDTCPAFQSVTDGSHAGPAF